jgi:hypothetical protein
MDETTKLFLLVATGGLAGAILTQLLQQWIVPLLWRPRLHVVFSPDMPGCVVETQTVLGVPQRYLRLKIVNTGRSSAEHVEISITRISFRAQNEHQRQFRDEVLDLKVAMTGAYPFRLPREGHRFVDLVFTKIENGATHDFVKNPMAMQTFGFGVGDYSANVFASANSARSRRVTVDWTWDGTFDGLEALGLGWLGHDFE